MEEEDRVEEVGEWRRMKWRRRLPTWFLLRSSCSSRGYIPSSEEFTG